MTLMPSALPDDVEILDMPSEVIREIGSFSSFDNHNGGQDLQDATFRSLIDFDAKSLGPREVIFETGAGTIGFSFVYEVPSTLVLRAAGNGGFSLATTRFVLPLALTDGGEVDVAWTYDVDDGNSLQSIGIVINGYRATETTMNLGGDWSGNDDASFGAASGNLAGTGQNSALSGIDFTSGSIDLLVGLEFYANTNYVPGSDDSDGDGLPDGWELLFDDELEDLGDGDQDGDGSSDRDEFLRSTDPSARDTDRDGLDDGDEAEAGTDPLERDSDGDTLSDGEEVRGDPPTDPLDADTDDDGFDDRSELLGGSDPTDSESRPETDCVGARVLELPTDTVHAVGPLPTYDGRGDTQDVTFAASIDFDDKPDGEREVIFETGGGSFGFSFVYEKENSLVLRAAGNSGLSVATARYRLTRHLIDSDLVETAWSYDVDNGNDDQTISIYLNGYRVAHVSMGLGGDWSGTNAASFGAASPQLAAGGNNTSIQGVDFVSGRIDLERGLERYVDTMFCPITNDTDGDSLPDEWERLFTENLSDISGEDSDSDGLSDTNELALGLDPTRADTDDDGLDDGAEMDRGTDPVGADSDGDGIFDGDEIASGTDPLDADTDDDSYRDGVEVANGSDPSNPRSVPTPQCDGVAELGAPTTVFKEIGSIPSFDNNGGNNDKLDVTFRTRIDFAEKKAGQREVIFETGGGTVGLSLTYEIGNTLVIRAVGNGGFSVLTAKHVVSATLIAGGDVDVAWTYDVDNGYDRQGIALILNHQIVSYASGHLGGDWSGTSDTSFGSATTNMAAGGNNQTIEGAALTSAVIDLAVGLEFHAAVLLCPEISNADDDSLPDEWEYLYSPGNLDGLGPGDADGDGLDDAGEFVNGSDPTRVDTDGDGLDDQAEFDAHSDPNGTDTDGDGLLDGDEGNASPPSDPTRSDTDSDRIDDGLERIIGSNATDASSPHTIADSFEDWSRKGSQGEAGWSYGYYNLTLDPDGTYGVDDFIAFDNKCGIDDSTCDGGGPVSPDGNHWSGTAWRFFEGAPGPWTRLTRDSSHPNGTNSDPSEEHWTIRRWTSDAVVNGAIVWHIGKLSPGGTGVTGKVLLNGAELDSSILRGDDVDIASRQVAVELTPGDVVELLHTPEGPGGVRDDGSDETLTWLRIVTIEEQIEPEFRRGDPDATGAINLTDAIMVLRFLFLGTANPECLDAADADDTGVVNLSDPIYLLNFLFLGGPPPTDPGSTACGADPTEDALAPCVYTAACAG